MYSTAGVVSVSGLTSWASQTLSKSVRAAMGIWRGRIQPVAAVRGAAMST